MRPYHTSSVRQVVPPKRSDFSQTEVNKDIKDKYMINEKLRNTMIVIKLQHIYIYIYRERERHIYIYIYIFTHVCIHNYEDTGVSRRRGRANVARN